jgi:hypothetical protein
MLGFDYEIRRRGFAGNSCQIVLELASAISPDALQKRLAELINLYPILRARPGGVFVPKWKSVGPIESGPKVRVQANGTSLRQKLFNEPLDIHRGELFRFDLIERTLVFTWAHALMDAKSAEYFLALVGGDNVAVPEPGKDWYAQRGTRNGGLRARGRQAWRELERLEKFKTALPVSLATRRRPVTRTMKYQVVAFSREDSVRVRANASQWCGFLGDTNFHLAATLHELHRLHERAGCASASYVLPIPVGLRPKGTHAPLFSNQVAMMLHQFLPEELGDMAQTVAAVKSRNAEYLRDEHIDPGIALAQLFRCLPLPLYMRLIKHELHGEICSLFFGDTATVDPALQAFLGAGIEKFGHVPAVTVPPGVGVVFYRFRDQLQFTLVHADGTLTDHEAAEFAAHLRARLLNP